MRFRERLVDAWYRRPPSTLSNVLLPLALLFRWGVSIRRLLYRAGLLRSTRIPAPVIVVGNVTVGGTGKTPLALALADALAIRGLHPGIVSRGHGGRHARRNGAPRLVARDDDPAEVGDEPLLYASRGFPVSIGRDRSGAAARLVSEHPEVDVVIADDGLQHYALHRDIEIAVVDGVRGLGNERMIPAGPLREPCSRLTDVSYIVVTDAKDGPDPLASVPVDVPRFAQSLVPESSLHQVADPGRVQPVASLAGQRVDAVAGIGHPERFFTTLEKLGCEVVRHAFPDHHAFTLRDLVLPGARTIVMTAKDAVKCRRFADARCWYLPVRADVDHELADRVEKTIRGPEAA